MVLDGETVLPDFRRSLFKILQIKQIWGRYIHLYSPNDSSNKKKEKEEKKT